MNTKPGRGMRVYYPTDKGPIDTYQLGHDGRIEFLGAEIGVDHLKKGSNTTDEWKKWAKDRGHSADEPGLIISKRLGGSGVDSVNLFPKSPSLEKTAWAQDEEKAFDEASEMKKWKKIKFFARFEYPEDDSRRPSSVEYQYELPSGTVLHNKVKNDPLESEEPKVEEEDDDEYEYEYEEEEEEEEAVEEAPKEEEKVVAEETRPVVETSSKVQETIPPSPPPQQKSPSPEVPPQPSVTSYEPQKSPSPPPPVTPAYSYRPPSPVAPSSPSDYPAMRAEAPAPPSPKKEKLSTPISAGKGAQGGLITRSDIIEMLPVIGTLKLAIDTLRAIFNRNTNLAFSKAIQFGISALGDFNFMRAFARHGRILIKPITEQKLVGFANKAEPQLIVFGACKAGNQVLSSLRRILS